MLVAFSGGGTGGHLFPGIAVARALSACRPGTEIVFYHGNRPVELEIVGKSGFQGVRLTSPRLPGIYGAALFPFRMLAALAAARRQFRRERPAIVVGLGGYQSVAPVMAAAATGIPVVLMEQNIVAGRANRLLSKRARQVFISYEQAVETLKSGARTMLTGNPVCEEFDTTTREDARHALGIGLEKTVILIAGGSQGASAVNEAFIACVKDLTSGRDVYIIHLTGKLDYDWVRAGYDRLGVEARVEPFSDEMHLLAAAANLAVARSGGTTVAEFAVCGLPAVYVPFPGTRGNEQAANARAMESAGAAVVIEQDKLAAETLGEAVASLLDSPERRGRMSESAKRAGRPGAAEAVAEEILKIVDEENAGDA